MIDLSIVSINYNTSQATIVLIKSIIEKTTRLKYEIIIVDNASEKEDFLRLQNFIKEQKNPNLKLVRSNINTGFGKGNNIGYQATSISRYVAFINNDVELLDDCFWVLKGYLDEHPAVGIVSPQSVNENLQFVPTIDHFASWQRKIFGRKILEMFNKKRFPRRYKVYQQPIAADYVAGSFMLMRRHDFDNIGGFDENIFLYYEETDLSRRMKNIGKKTVMIPTIRYKHVHGLSTKNSLATKLEQKISLIYVIRKHQGWLASRLILMIFGIKYFFSSLIQPKKFPLFKASLQGMPLSLSLKHKQINKEID
ncbi:glycosyltransferase family 2 protein [Vaginella massiliensis]|uniref:glycosyltransferase family 2 protein n=1 Tax=Vaginella massiliensis TaxID=1816680 RepID=UPI000837EE8D|nr:glycosyltransferase family 2 protein [Vaginella massiliensis]